MKLIAVVMGAPDYKVRFSDATTLLNYGFGKCRVYSDLNEDKLTAVKVEKGITEYANLTYQGPFQYMTTDGTDLSGITKTLELPETVTAPVEKGEVAGRAVYTLDGKEVGSVDILYADSVAAAAYKDYFRRALLFFLI